MRISLAASILTLGFFLISAPAQTVTPRWYKGNTHAHTVNSDGDSTPAEVAKWYKNNGYNFLFITDHEFITSAAPLNDSFAQPNEFIVFQGQEITDRVDKLPHHVNALGISSVILPKKGATSLANLQANVDAVLAVGGLPQINHPNFGWALNAETIAKTKGVMHFELFNAHPLVNNLGGGDSPSVEAIWDDVLSRGRLIYAMATDDVHSIKKLGDRSAPTPGHGWIMVKAKELSQPAIIDALRRGDFYASTGVEFAEYSADQKSISIRVKEQRWSKYRIQFIGKGGRILREIAAGTGSYEIKGNEAYVRVKVIESNGKLAWTQPVMIKTN